MMSDTTDDMEDGYAMLESRRDFEYDNLQDDLTDKARRIIQTMVEHYTYHKHIGGAMGRHGPLTLCWYCGRNQEDRVQHSDDCVISAAFEWLADSSAPADDGTTPQNGVE